MDLQDEAFIQAILEHPQEEVNWLAYADWLEDHGDPRAALYRRRRLTGSIRMSFVLVPRGSFWMGDGGEPGARQVDVPREFYLGVCTVTQEQWLAVMGSNPSRYSRTGSGKASVKKIADADLNQFPVENVSWVDAQEFIQKLNQRENGSGEWLYRLPREEEWDVRTGARLVPGEECAFDFYQEQPSNDLSGAQANFDSRQPAGKGLPGKYLKRPTKVGSYPPNRLGLHDLHGNVWEWIDTPRDSARVIRGGCWHNSGAGCRAANRNWDDPLSRRSSVGFRLVLVPTNAGGG